MLLSVLGFLFSDSEGAADGSFSSWSPFIAFAIVLAIMAFMPRIIRKIRRERQALAQQQTRELQNRPNIRSKADEILVELAEMSREINAQVDTKIRVLNKLIRDAEKIVKRYEELTLEDKVLHNSFGSVSAEKSVTSENQVTDKAEIKLPEIGDKAETKILKERVESDSVGSVAAEANNTSETGVWQRSVGAKIQELHAKGYEINDIARKTRMSTAEVTLMLEMFKKRK